MRFHKLEEFLREGGDSATLADDLRDAQKFYVGPVRRLPTSNLQIDEFPRLPFSNCAFEFEVDFAHEITLGPIGDEFILNPGGENMTVILLVHSGDGGHSFVGNIFFHDRSAERHVSVKNIWGSAGRFGVNLSGNKVTGDWEKSPMRPDELTFKRNAVGRYRAIEAFSFLLGGFLKIVNCVNVRTQVVEAPVALNKKRAKLGRTPLYSYRVLVLRPAPAQRENKGGTHDGPRIHLRRGHIKHRKTGDFWWQPHVVGDRARGVVMKDYRADKLLEA